MRATLRKYAPTALAWVLLCGIGVWFIFFATYHSENVARQSMMNKDKIDLILENQEIIKDRLKELENDVHGKDFTLLPGQQR